MIIIFSTGLALIFFILLRIMLVYMLFYSDVKFKNGRRVVAGIELNEVRSLKKKYPQYSFHINLIFYLKIFQNVMFYFTLLLFLGLALLIIIFR